MKEVGGHPFAAAWGFVSGRLLGSHGCSCRGCGVLLGSYSINLFGVWDGCVKGLLVNICGGTAESGDMRSPLDNTLIEIYIYILIFIDFWGEVSEWSSSSGGGSGVYGFEEFKVCVQF